MHRGCFTCKHRYRSLKGTDCDVCLDALDRPAWEPKSDTFAHKDGSRECHPVGPNNVTRNEPEGYTGPTVTLDNLTGEVVDRTEGVNPKDAIGATKPPTWSVVPRWLMLGLGRVMQIGAAKYGAFNYREAPVRASIYVEAIERHMQLWQDGEDKDPETGVSHLFSVMAGCAILADAQANGTWKDDRQKTGLARKFMDELQELMNSTTLPAYQG